MIRQFIDPANFQVLMIVPRRGVETHREAVHTFLNHYDAMSDGCYSMYGAFASAMSMTLPGYDSQANLRRAGVALKKWCAMPCPSTLDDFAPWLWAGLTVIVFAHCELGSTATPVRRCILGHLKSLGEAGREMRKHPLILSLTTLDIFEGLLYRMVPLLNIDEADVVGLDSFPGLAAQLIQFMSELCEVNYADPTVSNSIDAGLAWHDRLQELESRVETWQPEIPPESIKTYAAIDATHILTRTRVHKTAILLYIHRLKHSFGHEYSKARSLASSIISDLKLATATTQAAPPWVSLPFTFAAIEATDLQARSELLRDVDVYVNSLSPIARKMTKTFLEALWAARDCLGEFRWVDMMDSLPRICVYI